MNIEGNGTGKGTIYFAYEKGLLVDSAVELDMMMAIANSSARRRRKNPHHNSSDNKPDSYVIPIP